MQTTIDRPPIPQNVRQAVPLRAENCCEECGENLPLELHHLTYSIETWPGHYPEGLEPIFGRETEKDLLALCRDCHRSRHIGPLGDFFADPEECEGEWDYYHHVMDHDD